MLIYDHITTLNTESKQAARMSAFKITGIELCVKHGVLNDSKIVFHQSGYKNMTNISIPMKKKMEK